MPYSPSRWLESIGNALVPPAAAEHALGDLAECSTSNADYLWNLLSILPRVVWSQIRRRATIGGLVFHAFLAAFVLIAFQGFPKSPFFAQPWAAVRLAAPWAIWVIGCALAAAYGPVARPTWWSRKMFLATALAAVGAAAVLGVPVARVVMALGATFGTLLLLSMPWLTRLKPPPPLAPDTLAVHAQQFQRGIWWRNARESIACGVVLALNVRSFWLADTSLDRAGNALLIAGVGFIMGFLHLRAGSRTVPAADVRTIWQFHRRELARQRDILRAIVWWYLLPFVPGMIVSSASKWDRIVPSLVGMAVVIGMFVFIWRLNLWGARWLDGELQKVEGLEAQL